MTSVHHKYYTSDQLLDTEHNKNGGKSLRPYPHSPLNTSIYFLPHNLFHSLPNHEPLTTQVSAFTNP